MTIRWRASRPGRAQVITHAALRTPLTIVHRAQVYARRTISAAGQAFAVISEMPTDAYRQVRARAVHWGQPRPQPASSGRRDALRPHSVVAVQ